MKDKEVILEGGFNLKFRRIPQGLRDMYGQPPFSVLDARQGPWQNRKRKWLSLGIQSEIGRGDNLLKFSEKAQLKKKNYGVVINGPLISKDIDYYRHKEESKKKGMGQCLQTNIGEKYNRKQTTGTSIFDPVLCELMYNWFCPKNGSILDPFCGGSVRGIVAGFFNHPYIGFDIREEQTFANEYQLNEINRVGCISSIPKWVCDDANNMNNHIQGQEFDFVFSCPPYGNLEVYSEDPNDLSNKSYNDFIKLYDDIIMKACQKLKYNRFACFVVANFRDKSTGFYNDFVGDTVYSFKQAGLNLYNDIILVNSIGTLPIRVGKHFREYRKVGKTHQNILVFYKGDNQKNIKDINFKKTIEQEGENNEKTGIIECD